ncbi:hypothetical protein MHYP_G00126620 [Metynnis hypsauchen]
MTPQYQEYKRQWKRVDGRLCSAVPVSLRLPDRARSSTHNENHRETLRSFELLASTISRGGRTERKKERKMKNAA